MPVQFKGRIVTPEMWDALIPPKPEVSEDAKRAAQLQFELETDEDYLRRLFHEQN